MEKLLKQKGFTRILFDTIPQLALLLDPKCQVHALNRSAKAFFGYKGGEFKEASCGEVIRCVHHRDHPQGCGFSSVCPKCIVRNTALDAIVGTETRRAKGKLEFLTGQAMAILVSSSPFEYNQQGYAVIVIEDISLITELEGLIPICASCKKIRDDKGYWNRVESYIEAHSEAEFTHDICPECSEELYANMQAKIRKREKTSSV
ncbi:PAS domain-containing protein [Desulfosporosinus nitroreducens]|uniref:PAS domain-containing protein n=1 Tax=Desulfosporosinus nitroreducens TaxID=2018668 RepID=A0ABT8QLP2_9FIRM|nr:PAS domain-containing protein [Desulfosporosinus nitroreducens]MDO0822263.1 PAS domain-containing protein [Desulfosporosinus nitroreducens]